MQRLTLPQETPAREPLSKNACQFGVRAVHSLIFGGSLIPFSAIRKIAAKLLAKIVAE
jgi:hypothetical protein